MTIADGFSLWVGKQLADLFIGVAIFVSIFLILAILACISVWRGGEEEK